MNTALTPAPDPDKDKAVFEQCFAQYRTLNEQLNRIPPFAVTLTGGFWYIAVVIKTYGALGAGYENLARFCLMMFAGVCNLMLILIAIRVRDVMRAYETPLREYAAGAWPDTSRGRVPFLGDYSMIGMYCTLILGGAILSFAAGWVLFWKGTQQPTHVAVVGGIATFGLLLVAHRVLPMLGRK
jgi:hypothetical protein